MIHYITVRCNEELPGEYVRAGETYKVSIARTQARFVHSSGSGTFMNASTFRRAVKAGKLTIIEEVFETEQADCRTMSEEGIAFDNQEESK